jgi:predicted dehydrogenase
VLEDFLHAIKTNTKPRCDGPEGRRSLVLVQAIYEACRTGKRVNLEVIENR